MHHFLSNVQFEAIFTPGFMNYLVNVDLQLIGSSPFTAEKILLNSIFQRHNHTVCGNVANQRSNFTSTQIKSIHFFLFFYFFFAVMFQTAFRPGIKALTPFGGTYRQLLNTDVETSLWKYEIDTIAVTKHNRRLLWRGKCFEYWISLQKKVAQNELSHRRCWIGVH